MNDQEITIDTIDSRIEELSNQGLSVIRNDRGNGCAGPMICDMDDLQDVVFDSVCKIEDLGTEDLDLVKDACADTNHDIKDFSHVAVETDENGWTGFYLIW